MGSYLFQGFLSESERIRVEFELDCYNATVEHVGR